MIFKNRYCVSTALLIKKHASRELLSFKNPIYREKCGTFTNTINKQTLLRTFKK